MSRRDGKMYYADYVSKLVETDRGVSVNFDHDGSAGYINVFWTKTAAREMYGRNVVLHTVKARDKK